MEERARSRSSYRVSVEARVGDVEVKAVVDGNCDVRGFEEQRLIGAPDIVRVADGVAAAAARIAAGGGR